MGGLADRPEEQNDDDSKKSDIPSFSSGEKLELPVEKQFTHIMFCNQIQNISLDEAKQLLVDLHLLYLSQIVVFTKIAKQEFLGNVSG